MKYSKYRKQEPMKPTKKSSFPKRFLFIDTETKPLEIDNKSWLNTMYLGVAIYTELDQAASIKKRHVYRFDSAYDLLYIIATLSRKKSKIVVIGHNIAFDIEVLNLAKIFTDLGCNNVYPIRNGHTFMWRVSLGRGNLQFLDTGNYSATTLSQIGKDIGIPKMSIDFETCSDEELYIYCENDVLICEKFIIEYIRFLIEHDMGEMKPTIASQALTSFRHKFMTTPPHMHMNDHASEIEKYAYFGGRTEALRLGHFNGNPIYNLDVNSEYPAAMIMSNIPYRLVGYNSTPINRVLLHHIDHNYVIVNCRIKTDIPVFPMRAKIRPTRDKIIVEIMDKYSIKQSGLKIIYPIGEYKTWLHQAEFKYALEHDLVSEVYGYVLYHSAPIFDHYVNSLYALKAQYTNEGNKSFRLVTKLLQNSLYGKFGQECHETFEIGKIPSEDVTVTYGYSDKHGYTFTDINWFGTVYRTYQTGISTYAFPAIAGAVTSNARMILWNYREIAGQENTYYSDTDSLMVNSKGYDNLKPYLSHDELGKLDVRGQTDRLTIYGNKDYIFDGEATHKGIPAKAISEDGWEWRYMEFEGFKAWRNTGGNHPPKTEWVSKNRNPLYDKGLLKSDGTILPYSLQLDQVVYEYPLQEFQAAYHSVFPDSPLPLPPRPPASPHSHSEKPAKNSSVPRALA